MSIEIYGKNDCPYCELAKLACENYGIGYQYKLVDTPEAVEWLHENVNAQIKTVPAVIYDGVWIGGLDELKAKINESYTIENGAIKNVLNG